MGIKKIDSKNSNVNLDKFDVKKVTTLDGLAKSIADNYKNNNNDNSNSKSNSVLLVENYDLDEPMPIVVDQFEKYDLTDEELLKLSRLCIQEQGTAKGAAGEASLMANLFELRGGEYNGKKGAEGLYEYVRNGKWFYNAKEYMDKGSDTNKVTDKVEEAVKSVLVDGKRTLPKYVNQHDGTYGLIAVTNDGNEINKDDPSQYIPHVSKCIQNPDPDLYGEDAITWTYYCHPGEGSDPFGYSDPKKKKKYGEGHYDFDTGKYVEE